jgi:predicted anti-sigma-YlaC factor YlaD
VTVLPGLDCDQVVELVTDYLEGALDDMTAARVRAHLAECPGCDTYLEQIRDTVRTLGHVPAETLSPEAQNDLMAAFRDFRREP